MTKLELTFFIAVFVILMALITCTPAHATIQPNARVPILLYHSRHVDFPCDYANNNMLALEQDLETLHKEGFTVVPLYWLVEWKLGWRRGDTLPDKPVGISLDDGFDLDYLDRTSNSPECGPHKSAYTILKEFREKYEEELPPLSPHITTFVIASPVVRSMLEDDHFQSNWWASAHYSEFMEVQSHGSDHDHTIIEKAIWDEAIGDLLPASGHGTGGDFSGKLDPRRIDNHFSSSVHIAYAGEYIKKKIGMWPDLFAHPMGLVSNYTRDVYFPNYFHEHGTVAAFCTELGHRGADPRNYMTRKSNRWCIPRLSFQYSWRSPEEFLDILNGASYD